MAECMCGCGQTVARRWVHGHNKRSLHLRDGEGRKRCSRCGGWYDEAQFHQDRSMPDGKEHRCKPCMAEMGFVLRIRKMGLNLDEVNAWIAEHGRVCALCGAGNDLCVDHCHQNGHFRGMLCRRCNAGLGQFQDDPGLLRRAAEFLELFPAP